MDTLQQIARHVEQLPPAKQEQVLRYVTALADGRERGENATALLQFAGILDSDSAREMMEAIEAGCEQIDSSEW